MVKHEIKVDFNETEALTSLIEKSYFEEGLVGKIMGKKHFLTIENSSESYELFKGLNNATIKLYNDIVDGSIRVLVDESDGDIKLYPISIYCMKENEKYTFY